MYIIAIAWIYVVLMMSITEHSAVAGIMTFLLYGILPLSIILYIIGAPERRRKREHETAERSQCREESSETNPAQCRPDIAPEK